MSNNRKWASIIKIVSGGQSGADRAALDVALRHGFPHGGWCPKGRTAEDGAIGGQYRLVETPSTRYDERIWLWVYEVIEGALFWSQAHPGMLGGPGEG